MEKKYSKAYTEVLEILRHLPKEELEKIPKTELQFYEDNCDKNYKYEYDNNVTVDKQQISREANTVIVAIYMNYFANERQKGIIDEILKQNSVREEKSKEEKYDVNKIFEKSKEDTNNANQIEENKEPKKETLNKSKNSESFNSEHLPIEVDTKKENFIKKIINKIKSIFQNKKEA